MKDQKLSLAEFAKLHEADVLTANELTEVQGGWIQVVGWAIGAISTGVAAYFGFQNTGTSAAQSVCNNALMAGTAASAASGSFKCEVQQR